ncbi:hypothetical protein V5799_011123 [Amblyomma americanum]|uniref:Ubiquitin-conjugating enzyme E2 Z n=1 Tax=Amblyomma americanum TaxID=6943 RepID=A0AAQ4EI76_AMBAM
MSSPRTDNWDPLAYMDQVPTSQCLQRLQRDIADFHANPLPGLFISPEEGNVTKLHALVVGPAGTPYEGGFFQFLMKFPPDYPISPPRVRIVTTDAGRVAFNPNLYASGKVCLSILGTWFGPAWSPVQGLESVLISVQSLVSEKPYHNEPAFAQLERSPGDAKRYDDFIQHETIRVAVCGMVEAALRDNPECPKAFREEILKAFAENCGKFEDIANNLHRTNTMMYNVLAAAAGVFQYETLLTRLRALKKEVNDKIEAAAAAKRNDQIAADIPAPAAGQGN